MQAFEHRLFGKEVVTIFLSQPFSRSLLEYSSIFSRYSRNKLLRKRFPCILESVQMKEKRVQGTWKSMNKILAKTIT